VVQEDTPRSFPLPPPMDPVRKSRLVKHLVTLGTTKRNMKLTPGAETWYRGWYNSREERGTEEKQFSGYFERKPDHLLRLAMILSVSEDVEGVLEKRHLEQSLKILNWIEKNLPNAYDQLAQTSVGEDARRLIDQLKKHSGNLKHSDWLRKNSMRMKAREFKEHVATLMETRLIDFDSVNKVYYLTPEGWKA
jgi:hypothetical protein